MGIPSPRREEDAAAAVDVFAFIGVGPDGGGIARAADESNVTAGRQASHAQDGENNGITKPWNVDAMMPSHVRFPF
jgi:hypothetical protein